MCFEFSMAQYIKYEKKGHHKIKKFSFSNTEIKHLLISLFVILLTLVVLDLKKSLDLKRIPMLVLIYLFSIGLGFILHELAHKFFAQNYGFVSEFRSDFQMLFFGFFLAVITGFIFFAPGAVLILGHPNKKQNGIISIVGPLTNLGLCFIFLLLKIIFSPLNNSVFGILVNTSIMINAFLGIFNMLPFSPLDG